MLADVINPFCRQGGFVLIYAQNESPQLTEIANYNFVAPLGNLMTTTPVSFIYSVLIFRKHIFLYLSS